MATFGNGTRLTKSDIISSINDVILSSKIVASNTLRYCTEAYEAIRYWNTDVVKIFKDGTIELNSGGYKTQTTKTRINDLLHELRTGFSVYQQNGSWYLSGNEQRSCFYDGIQIKDRKILKPIEKDSNDQIKKLINKFTDHIKKLDHIPEPNSGDCWICMMIDRNNQAKPGENLDHLLSHLKENYVHGTLIVNAYKLTGRTEFWLQCSYHDANLGTTPERRQNAKNEIARTVKRYLKSRFGIPQ